MAEGEDQEGVFEVRRPGALDPIGHALRATYHAENHDSLGQDLTGLMLQLARVENSPAAAPERASPGADAPLAKPSRRSWMRRLFGG